MPQPSNTEYVFNDLLYQAHLNSYLDDNSFTLPLCEELIEIDSLTNTINAYAVIIKVPFRYMPLKEYLS